MGAGIEISKDMGMTLSAPEGEHHLGDIYYDKGKKYLIYEVSGDISNMMIIGHLDPSYRYPVLYSLALIKEPEKKSIWRKLWERD